MHSLQAMIDGMNTHSQRERAKTQMTLGKMIEALQAMPSDAVIKGICYPHSYRGYYSDLAFEPAAQDIKASEALMMCRDVMGKVFDGYKGGDYVMGALTPLWLANYGYCGRKIMGIHSDGVLITAEDD